MSEENPALTPLCPPETAYGLPWDWTRPDRAIVQEGSRRFPTAASWFVSQCRSCGICGGQTDIWAGFLLAFRFSLPSFIPSNVSHSLIYHQRYAISVLIASSNKLKKSRASAVRRRRLAAVNYGTVSVSVTMLCQLYTLHSVDYLKRSISLWLCSPLLALGRFFQSFDLLHSR
jgi:hypothetical protein